jgi:iron-sulfur cluster assembly enzyme ISCU, mitochondrial
MTELISGMTLEEAGKVKNTHIAQELCLPPVKLHCSMLAEDAIKSAIDNYYTKNPSAKRTDLSGETVMRRKLRMESESSCVGSVLRIIGWTHWLATDWRVDHSLRI